MSNRVTITLTIDLPDGVVPDVDYGSGVVGYGRETASPDLGGVWEEPPHVAETFAPFGGGQPPAAPICSTHNEPMKRYPAGVSKKTGKPFNASWRCPVVGCTTAPLWDRDAA